MIVWVSIQDILCSAGILCNMEGCIRNPCSSLFTSYNNISIPHRHHTQTYLPSNIDHIIITTGTGLLHARDADSDADMVEVAQELQRSYIQVSELWQAGMLVYFTTLIYLLAVCLWLCCFVHIFPPQFPLLPPQFPLLFVNNSSLTTSNVLTNHYHSYFHHHYYHHRHYHRIRSFQWLYQERVTPTASGLQQKHKQQHKRSSATRTRLRTSYDLGVQLVWMPCLSAVCGWSALMRHFQRREIVIVIVIVQIIQMGVGQNQAQF